MLQTSNFISAKEGAKDLNKSLKELQELQAIKKDLELQLKPIKEKMDKLQEFIMTQSNEGLNETTQYIWQLQINANSESISLKAVIKNAPELYEALKDKNLISVKKGAKSIKNIVKK